MYCIYESESGLGGQMVGSERQGKIGKCLENSDVEEGAGIEGISATMKSQTKLFPMFGGGP